MSKITRASIDAKITDVAYIHLPNSTVTICSITLQNGYSVRGESACVDPAEYVEITGRALAYNDAFDKIWALEAYLLAEQLNKVPSPPPCGEMRGWQQRVVDEEQALNDKLQKLLMFQAREEYKALPAETKSLLCRQANAMHDYLNALKCRIEAF